MSLTISIIPVTPVHAEGEVRTIANKKMGVSQKSELLEHPYNLGIFRYNRNLICIGSFKCWPPRDFTFVVIFKK